MNEPKLCQNCKWSQPEKDFEWNNRCFHPIVIMRDPYALSWNTKGKADHRGVGASCREERAKRWPFGLCGMRGALYEQQKEGA